MSKLHRYDPRTPAIEMFGHRRARAVIPGYYTVLGRDGRTRYDVIVDEAYEPQCSCPAGSHGRPCYHAAVVLRSMRNKGVCA